MEDLAWNDTLHFVCFLAYISKWRLSEILWPIIAFSYPMAIVWQQERMTRAREWSITPLWKIIWNPSQAGARGSEKERTGIGAYGSYRIIGPLLTVITDLLPISIGKKKISSASLAFACSLTLSARWELNREGDWEGAHLESFYPLLLLVCQHCSSISLSLSLDIDHHSTRTAWSLAVKERAREQAKLRDRANISSRYLTPETR